MSLPYYISNEIRDWFRGEKEINEECVVSKIPVDELMKIKDYKTGKIYLCGVIHLTSDVGNYPVLVVEGHVFDMIHRICNEEFSTYVYFMNVKDVDIIKSRYVLTERMLNAFVKRDIKFMKADESFNDLWAKKVNDISGVSTSEGWLMEYR